MRVLPGEEMMYPASALQDIKRRAIKEFAEKLYELAKGQGGVVYDIDIKKLVKEVCGNE